VGYSQRCTYSSSKGVVNTRGYVNVAANSMSAHMAAVNIGPVSVAIEADQTIFQMYSGGIINSAKCGSNLDHAVTLIGYGTDANGNNYWLLKNSWGTWWGEQGFFRLGRSSSTTATVGICGMYSWSSYPLV